MQTVSAAFTAEEKDSVRQPTHSLLMSWNKFNLLDSQTFTIGVSTIGGNDIIGANPGGIGSPGQYQYVDESDYVSSLDYERQLNIPLGGLTKAYSSVTLNNTSGRFLPDYMGGTNAETFTSILPKRPQIINTGLKAGGVDENVIQFSGLLNKTPIVNQREREARLEADDYSAFFEKRFVDDTTMYTGVTTDFIIEDIFSRAGMTTSQYSLDTGLNTIPFTIVEKGKKWFEVLNELAIAENGHIFQDEEGIFKFWNRQKWFASPYTESQKTIFTSQVINAEAPNEDHIINVVNIESDIYEKRSSQQIFDLSGTIEILANQPTEVFVNLDDPILELISTTVAGNTKEDGSGAALTIVTKSTDVFSQAIKYVFESNTTGFITQLDVNGRSAIVGEELTVRKQDDSSVTAYQERPITIQNKYIQNRTWGESLANVLLDRYGEPDNLQKITIRAMPELQLGDLVSWQGRDWRLYSIRTGFDPASGFTQELLLVKPVTDVFFTIGVSVIGGTDKIAA